MADGGSSGKKGKGAVEPDPVRLGGLETLAFSLSGVGGHWSRLTGTKDVLKRNALKYSWVF